MQDDMTVTDTYSPSRMRLDGRHRGGCSCGAVRYEVDAPIYDLNYCHCNSCRKAVGATPVAWGSADRVRFAVTQGRLAEHSSSVPVMRGFCAACGTSLTYRHESRPDEIDGTLATLDQAALFAPQFHIWVRDKLPWVLIDDGLPQFTGSSAGG